MTYVFPDLNELADFLEQCGQNQQYIAENSKRKTDQAKAVGIIYGFTQAAHIVRNTHLGKED